jgi:hypothetical protein
VVGVENQQVMRANRTHPEWGDGFGWTYNHAPNLAYWKGKFYFHYLSNPFSEHVAPGRTLLCVSADGRNWGQPVELFPPYEFFGGEMAMMHQRMGFYVAPNGRLLAFGFYAHAPNPFGRFGLGRAVREIYENGGLGPIYFIRYNRASGWGEENTSFPYYQRSSDPGFIEACESVLEDRLIRQQWWDEERKPGEFFGVEGRIQALSFYHREDGAVVGLWKHSLAALSFDEGVSWTEPVRVPTLIMSGAKIWGQKTDDGRYALVYNPIRDSERRYPLAIITGDDGIHFDDMLAVHHEVPPRRFWGIWKDWGPQYNRGIAEGNGNPPGPDMWVAYSVNKEDMWVSRIPVPVRSSVRGFIEDSFDDLTPGERVPDWNIYSAIWAPTEIVDCGGSAGRCLRLQDRDPYDYARALRIFEESQRVRIQLNLNIEQQGDAELELEIQDQFGNRPIQLAFKNNGTVHVRDGADWKESTTSETDRWLALEIRIRADDGVFDVVINDDVVAREYRFFEDVHTVEHLLLRSGAFRTSPTRQMDPQELRIDEEGADEPVELSSFLVDRVLIRPGEN